MIVESTFRGCWHWQNEPDDSEDGDFWVWKGFPRQDTPNTSICEEQECDIWSDQHCIADMGSNIGFAETISLADLDSQG